MEYFLIYLLFNPLNFANQLTQNNNHILSKEILNKYNPKPDQLKQYYFILSNNYYATNNLEGTKKSIEHFHFSNCPTNKRYEVIIELLEDQIKNWKTGDLSDIARDMRISKDSLESLKPNSNIQKTIISKLDKLIEDEENNRKKLTSNATPIPLDETEIANQIIGKGIVDSKQFEKIKESWGKLPEQKRIDVIHQITKDYPPKYKSMIEDYFKSLQKN